VDVGKYLYKGFLQDIFSLGAIARIPEANGHEFASVLLEKLALAAHFILYAALNKLLFRHRWFLILIQQLIHFHQHISSSILFRDL
jgi:hypothetical protein